MTSTSPDHSMLVVVVGLVGFLALLYWWTKPTHPFPPGPKRLPIIGNMLDLPKDHAWFTYQQWSKEYRSDVIHVDTLGTHLIILNSAKAARELFEKRSSLYSDSSFFIVLHHRLRCMLKLDWAFGFAPYGQELRRHRKVLHRYFSPAASEQYHQIEAKATLELLQRLLDTPQDFVAHLRHMAGRTILEIAYGIEAQPRNDPYINIVEKAIKAMTVGATQRARVFDTFPICTASFYFFLRSFLDIHGTYAVARLPEYLPGMSIKREAKKWSSQCALTVEMPFRAVKEAIASGSAKESVASSLLQNGGEDGSPYDEDVAKKAIASMYLGKSTPSTINTFILLMVLYPEVQQKAHAEIDAIIGHGRLPKHSDESLLPYVGAVVKEVLRWAPIAPLGVPHSVLSDDIYKGYLIPAGSVVLGNCWAILHDETMFPDPDAFKPERFLDTGGGATSDYPDAAFGFGRRVCPGRFMAHAAVWLAIVSILSTFDISKAVDEDGNEIVPAGEFIDGLIMYPAPFKCRIEPRSTSAVSLIRTASA
ncbi:cytochrome P450 monooxygenase 71 [Heterobasidion irregulare TC 32-1]|uniref:Cytochrome P450 monooxygenase 71 n=1 Tax=Heterobasidion irregulare (strain TC 32-1) TaxID=747525 RepID=W4K106_HETIT|nr:cytochrome P450 monooxygenase 71 [Heterobasidion irregulare TC 32-1]ETW79020.1 cytochrome P450 monooxygenase 71 [Heterobasidion irregulare TC 32-1]